ncbi:hypothetical protein ACQKQD_32445 [Methylobacterium sp. NPDC080182]|uniref:hypothetical protein n=1 Tax=Methylobacterium sp. NPDC080182 TaxID=3390590 RepID=UPI003CFFA598
MIEILMFKRKVLTVSHVPVFKSLPMYYQVGKFAVDVTSACSEPFLAVKQAISIVYAAFDVTSILSLLAS